MPEKKDDPVSGDATRRGNTFITWLALEFPPTPYLVDMVRVTMDTTLAYQWKMIDAVRLDGAP